MRRINPDRSSYKLKKNGSERESEKSIISRRFPQDEEFGFQGSQPLGFQ